MNYPHLRKGIPKLASSFASRETGDSCQSCRKQLIITGVLTGKSSRFTSACDVALGAQPWLCLWVMCAEAIWFP